MYMLRFDVETIYKATYQEKFYPKVRCGLM